MTNSPAPDPARDHRPSPSVPGTLDGSMLAPGDLAAAEVAALCWLDPDFDPWSNDPERPASGDAPLEEHRYEAIIVDPYSSPPEGWETLSVAERRDLLGDDNCPVDPTDDPDQDVVPESLEAGFLHQYPTPGATGFRAGGPLDLMLPGNELAWHLGAARQTGLDQLSDDELIGVLAAARRIQSWQTELELAATAELDARRAGPDGREGEHVADELAAALTLTGRAAQAQLELSRQLERLPHTAGLLAAGIIDRPRAVVIASHLALLNDADAAAVDALVAAKAGAMTTGQLSARCHRAVVGYDPLAYLRRKKQAEKNARVECWTEHTGTAAIAGRDLDRALAIAADKSLDEAARWLQHQGVEGTLDELRTAVFLARLCQRPVETILPPPPGPGPPPPRAPPPRPRPPRRPGHPARQRHHRRPGHPARLHQDPARRLGHSRPGHPRPGHSRPGHSRPRGADRSAPHHAGHQLARPERAARRDHRHRRRRARRRPHLPPARRHHRPQPRRPVVHHPHRPRRTARRPRLRPRRTRPARPRQTRLVRHHHDHPDRNRQLRPPPPVRRIPAQRHPPPPDQDPQPQVRIPRLPPGRHPLRRRPHDPVPQGRTDLRM
jgi:hypothetical protein